MGGPDNSATIALISHHARESGDWDSAPKKLNWEHATLEPRRRLIKKWEGERKNSRVKTLGRIKCTENGKWGAAFFSLLLLKGGRIEHYFESALGKGKRATIGRKIMPPWPKPCYKWVKFWVERRNYWQHRILPRLPNLLRQKWNAFNRSHTLHDERKGVSSSLLIARVKILCRQMTRLARLLWLSPVLRSGMTSDLPLGNSETKTA